MTAMDWLFIFIIIVPVSALLSTIIGIFKCLDEWKQGNRRRRDFGMNL